MLGCQHILWCRHNLHSFGLPQVQVREITGGLRWCVASLPANQPFVALLALFLPAWPFVCLLDPFAGQHLGHPENAGKEALSPPPKNSSGLV